MDREIVILQANHDQDVMDCRAWMNESSNDDLFQVWLAIQQKSADPITELVMRFAQLGFTQTYLDVKRSVNQ